MNITAIILAKNEGNRIEDTVKSLEFCSTVIVVDDESTDDTAIRAKKAGATVLLHPKKNEFAGQRNWAMEHSTSEWILFIDADETISDELRNEILHVISNKKTEYSAFRLPRRDFFWGQELKFGETLKARSEGIVRLIKKGSGVWTGAVHETFISTGEVGKLHGYINHESHETLSTFIQDINVYSTIRAEELAKTGRTTNWVELVCFPFAKFIYTYFILGGFLDGAPGFVYSFVMSFHSFLVRAKLLTKSYG